jgi:hypothetical protein
MFVSCTTLKIAPILTNLRNNGVRGNGVREASTEACADKTYISKYITNLTPDCTLTLL